MNILIELDAETYQRLEKVAPAKSRKRSAFIRAAIQKSLWDLEEQRTRRAYLEMPEIAPAAFDPDVWEPLPYGGFDPPAVERARAAGHARSTPKRSSQRKRGGATRKVRGKKVRSRKSRK